MKASPVVVLFALTLLAACGGSSSPQQALDGGSDLPDLLAPDTKADAADLAGPGDAVSEVLPQDLATGDLDTGPDSYEGPPVWGWISLIEWNDVCDQWYLKTQWFGGVRAHFAEAPSFVRALPHTLGFARPVETVGACTLYDTDIMNDTCLANQCLCLDKGVECYNEDETERWCGQDEVCVDDPLTPPEHFDHGICIPLPAHYDVGQVTISGPKGTLKLNADEFDRYQAKPVDPNDLFQAGDELEARTSGGQLPPMSFTARGVAPLELDDQVVEVVKEQPSIIKWTPADPESRIQVVLAAGSHDPNPLGGAIVCDVPDSDGQVAVAYSLMSRLYYLSCNGMWLQKCSRITRYSRDHRQDANREVEFFVGSARNLQILWE